MSSKTEKANINYGNDKIIITGESFSLEMPASFTSLMGIYTSGRGKETVKLTLKNVEKVEPMKPPKEIPVAVETPKEMPVEDFIPIPIKAIDANTITEVVSEPEIMKEIKTQEERPDPLPIQEIMEEEVEEEEEVPAPRKRRSRSESRSEPKTYMNDVEGLGKWNTGEEKDKP